MIMSSMSGTGVTAPEWLSDSWSSAGNVVAIIVAAVVLRLIVGHSITKFRSTMLERDRERVATGGKDRGLRVEARVEAVTQVLRSLASTFIYVTALLLVLAEMGVSLGPLIASAGIFGVALGFGAQYLVRDVLAGVFVLIEDQYGVGDWIVAGAASGSVEGFTLRSTRIRDISGTVWHIPNGSVEGVGNMSQNWARAVVDVVVENDTDIARARSVIGDAARRFAADETTGAHLVGEPAEQGIAAMGPRGITLRVVVDTEPSTQWRTERELRERIKAALDEAGIRLQVHHLDSGES